MLPTPPRRLTRRLGRDYRVGLGGPAGPVPDLAAGPPASSSPSSSSSSNPVSSAFNAVLADLLAGAQVAVGITLLGLGVLLVVSQTSAAAAAGRGAAGGARRAARLIPGVGVLA